MRKLFIASIVTAALFVVSGSAAAQSLQLGLGGGPSVPTGDLADAFGTGFHLHGTVGFDVRLLPFGVRLDASYDRFRDGGAEQKFLAGSVNAIVPLGGGITRPYLLAGAGLYRMDASWPHGDHTHDSAHTEPGVNLGAGVEFRLLRLSAYAESRIHHVFDHDHAQRFIPLAVGIRL